MRLEYVYITIIKEGRRKKERKEGRWEGRKEKERKKERGREGGRREEEGRKGKQAKINYLMW